MSSIITTNFSTLIAQQFVNLLDVAANSYLPLNRRSYVFASIGKQTVWDETDTPPTTPGQATRDLIAYHDRAILSKRLSLDNVSFVVPRYNWTTGVTYSRYGCTVCPIGTPFYVLNSKGQVFKCLDNNNSSPSTDEPELFLSSTSLAEPFFITSDGYKWKYLYTLSSDQNQKFLNDNWMPVTYNRFVRAEAINRSIDIVRIENSGNNYVDGSTQGIITVDGDGINAVLKANVVDGQVVNIVIQNRGQDYTKANLIFTDISGGIGLGASANVILSPQNGHGYDPVEELYANTIMFNVDFEGSENGVFPAENEFREISLLHNPYVYDTETLASSDVYTLYSKILVSPGVGDYNNDEIIIQGEDLESATFSAEVISFDENTNILFVNNLKGTFNSNQPVKGLNSGSIRIGISKTPPTLELYSGKILFVSNKVPVTRDPDQTDRIRFILSF
jgi:hypothetical protein